MTDYEIKLAEVKQDKKNTIIEDFECYESTDDEQVILVYESYFEMTEWIFTKTGKFIEKFSHKAY